MNNAPVFPSKWSLWGTFLADILPKTLNKSSLVFSLLFNCSLCIQIRSWIVYWSRKSVWEQEFMRARIAPNSYLSDKGREYKYVVIWKCRRYRFLGPASCQSRATEQQLLHQLYTPPPAPAPAHCTSSIPRAPAHHLPAAVSVMHLLSQARTASASGWAPTRPFSRRRTSTSWKSTR